MSIRAARRTDHSAIEVLLGQLGYEDTGRFLFSKLERMLSDTDECLLVYEGEAGASGGEAPGGILAFISVHFIPQIALPGDFARISYFSVDDAARGQGIGREMEEYVVALARERQCDRIEVHCHWRRGDAHRFYARQGFEEAPKYLIKRLG